MHYAAGGAAFFCASKNMIEASGEMHDLVTNANSSRRRLIDRLGLNRPELRAWALYDWANSAVMTTIISAVFPIYFYRVAGAGPSACGRPCAGVGSD